MADSLLFGLESPRKERPASCSSYCSLGMRWKEAQLDAGLPTKLIVIGRSKQSWSLTTTQLCPRLARLWTSSRWRLPPRLVLLSPIKNPNNYYLKPMSRSTEISVFWTFFAVFQIFFCDIAEALRSPWQLIIHSLSCQGPFPKITSQAVTRANPRNQLSHEKLAVNYI